VISSLEAEVVHPDLAGGIVYQSGEQVLRRVAGSTESQVVSTGVSGSEVTLYNVVNIGGAAHAIVESTPPVDDIINRQGILLEVDLASGQSTELKRYGTFEGGLYTVSWDGANYVIGSFSEASTSTQLIDRNGQSVAWTSSLSESCFDDTECPSHTIASPDGATFYYVAVMNGERQLIAWDRSSDSFTWSVGITGNVRSVDLDDDVITINRWGDDFLELAPPIFIDIDIDFDPNVHGNVDVSEGAVAGWGFTASPVSAG
jgi:hypothetical protein